MAGSKNFVLAKSFYDSRYGPIKIERKEDFERNAGACQLYRKENNEPYGEPKNFISYGNKQLVREPIKLRTMYGHSERILMWKILDELITHEDFSNHKISRPSDLVKDTDLKENVKIVEIIKAMMGNAEEYKNYLEKKGFIVKMWSERPACEDDYEIGKGCRKFLRDICPKGSQFGYIVHGYKIGQFVDVETASRSFEEAYKNHNVKNEELETKMKK